MLVRNQADGERMASSDLGLKDSCMSFPPVLPGYSKLSVALRKDVRLLAFQFLSWGHKPNGTVQSGVVVMIDELPNDSSGIPRGKRHLGPDTLTFEQPMPSLNLPVALRVKGSCSHVAHPAYTDELLEVLEVLGNELGAVVGDDPGSRIRELLSCPLKNNLHIGFRHGFTNLPMHNEAAVSVQETAKVIEGPTDIEVRHIHMPVLMGTLRLLKALASSRVAAAPAPEQSSILEHPVDRARAYGNNVSVEHHEGDPPVSLFPVFAVETNNRFPLPGLKPRVPRNPSVVQVDLPITLLPVIELTRGQPEPADKPERCNARFLCPDESA